MNMAKKKKLPVKKAAAAAKKNIAKTKPVAQKSKPANNRAKSSWLDAESHAPVIERYARRLGPFVEAMADGKIDEGEVQAQEKRLVKLMKEVEPTLSPVLHEKVTQLLYELTAYNLMHVLHSIEQARPKSTFQG
jgi:hypothetical protein